MPSQHSDTGSVADAVAALHVSIDALLLTACVSGDVVRSLLRCRDDLQHLVEWASLGNAQASLALQAVLSGPQHALEQQQQQQQQQQQPAPPSKPQALPQRDSQPTGGQCPPPSPARTSQAGPASHHSAGDLVRCLLQLCSSTDAGSDASPITTRAYAILADELCRLPACAQHLVQLPEVHAAIARHIDVWLRPERKRASAASAMSLASRAAGAALLVTQLPSVPSPAPGCSLEQHMERLVAALHPSLGNVPMVNAIGAGRAVAHLAVIHPAAALRCGAGAAALQHALYAGEDADAALVILTAELLHAGLSPDAAPQFAGLQQRLVGHSHRALLALHPNSASGEAAETGATGVVLSCCPGFSRHEAAAARWLLQSVSSATEAALCLTPAWPPLAQLLTYTMRHARGTMLALLAQEGLTEALDTCFAGFSLPGPESAQLDPAQGDLFLQAVDQLLPAVRKAAEDGSCSVRTASPRLRSCCLRSCCLRSCCLRSCCLRSCCLRSCTAVECTAGEFQECPNCGQAYHSPTCLTMDVWAGHARCAILTPLILANVARVGSRVDRAKEEHEEAKLAMVMRVAAGNPHPGLAAEVAWLVLHRVAARGCTVGACLANGVANFWQMAGSLQQAADGEFATLARCCAAFCCYHEVITAGLVDPAFLAASLAQLGYNRAGIPLQVRDATLAAMASVATALPTVAAGWLSGAAGAVSEGGWRHLAAHLLCTPLLEAAASTLLLLVMAADAPALSLVAQGLAQPCVFACLADHIQAAVPRHDAPSSALRPTPWGAVRLAHALLSVSRLSCPLASSFPTKAAADAGWTAAATALGVDTLSTALCSWQALLQEMGPMPHCEGPRFWQALVDLAGECLAWPGRHPSAADRGGRVPKSRRTAPRGADFAWDIHQLSTRVDAILEAHRAPAAPLTAAEEREEVERLMAELGETAATPATSLKAKKGKKKKKPRDGASTSGAADSATCDAGPIQPAAASAVGDPIAAGPVSSVSAASLATPHEPSQARPASPVSGPASPTLASHRGTLTLTPSGLRATATPGTAIHHQSSPANSTSQRPASASGCAAAAAAAAAATGGGAHDAKTVAPLTARRSGTAAAGRAGSSGTSSSSIAAGPPSAATSLPTARAVGHSPSSSPAQRHVSPHRQSASGAPAACRAQAAPAPPPPAAPTRPLPLAPPSAARFLRPPPPPRAAATPGLSSTTLPSPDGPVGHQTPPAPAMSVESGLTQAHETEAEAGLADLLELLLLGSPATTPTAGAPHSSSAIAACKQATPVSTAPPLPAASGPAAPPLLPPPARQQATRQEPPDHLCCPITTELLEQPVSAADGFVYSRAAIEEWLERSNLSPMTGEPLLSRVLTPSHMARGLVLAWREEYGLGRP